MVTSTVQILILMTAIEAVFLFSLEAVKQRNGSPISTFNKVDGCKKETFVTEYVNKKKLLTDEDYHSLQTCSNSTKTCRWFTGTLSVTYVEDAQGKYLILFDVYQLIKQDCWGYALQYKDDIATKTVYFNFNGKHTDFRHFIYFRLGFNYNFTVTPLPTGKPSTILTKAPSACELDVIDTLYYRIKDKEIFKDCPAPDYESRRAIATKICIRYPRNPSKRYKMTKHQVIEQKCKFAFVPENAVSNILTK